MKKKTKIIIAASVAAVILLALVAVILIVKFSGNTEEGTFEAWKEKPFIYEGAESEPTYTSYKEPFKAALISLSGELEAKSQELGTELKMLGGYGTAENTPTLIIAYQNGSDKINLLICKFSDGKFYKSYIETELKEINETNDIYTVSGTDITVIRSGIDTELGRQIILDFTGKDYASVKDNEYELGHTADMDETLKEYNSGETELISFNEKSVKSDIQAEVFKSLQIE